jgi:hypothetical protein
VIFDKFKVSFAKRPGFSLDSESTHKFVRFETLGGKAADEV